ncbi:MAG: YidC/Oxa1 family membrane protein insertase [Candidatus Colwellbacteria bacterium]|nr:YidC/Oxa1 family membrane protein insertase [Candidatus Colwellbacteria bacterium]
MSSLFNAILYHPILNAMVFLYNTIAFRDLGIAIIFITIVVRFVLFPMYQKTLRQQAISAKMNPEMLRIQKEFKDDKERQTKELLALYQKYKINPFYMILVLLIQIPVFFAIWKAITAGASGAVSSALYPFITDPGTMNKMFLGLVDLGSRSILIAIIAAALQFLQMRMSMAMTPKNANMPAAFSGNQMAFIMGGVTLAVLWNLPAALGIYWVATTVFSIVQQWIVNNSLKNEELKGNN